MINKRLFQRTKASNQDFRILADAELYLVNGGTGSLESEGASEVTSEVQCDSSDSGSNEDKLAELASQSVASTEAPAESAPTSEATTIDSTPIETQTDSQVDNTVAETEGASLQGINTVSSLGENVLAERLSSQIESLEQANYDARSGSYMAERGDDSSSSAEALRAAKEQAIISATEQVKWEAPSPLQVDENGLYSIRDPFGGSTASSDMGTQANQAVKLEMTDMRESALGLAESEPTTLDITDQTSATASLKVIDNALQRALNQEASIGATMNRLDFTSNNLSTASENVASAEATYRDADMAKEMTQFTKNNILMQASTQMLAQANQMPQGILSLLQ